MDGLCRRLRRRRRRPVLTFPVASRPSFCRYAAALAVLYCCTSSVAGAGADGPRCPDDACAGVRCPPRDRRACPLGLVPDGCACCPHGVCGLGEAAECDEARRRPCADDLECVPQPKMEDGGPGSAVYRCACKEKRLACGSDNKTYGTACLLNEAAAALNGSLRIQHWGPCQSAPVIRSVPKNLAVFVGQPAVFDCEVKGYPLPTISWRFTDIHGITKWLPGDDTFVSIQIRGGPERLTVTSWVQITEFKLAHAGNYTCLGVNLVDTAMASAVLDEKKMI